jgi:hypothetical protein
LQRLHFAQVLVAELLAIAHAFLLHVLYLAGEVDFLGEQGGLVLFLQFPPEIAFETLGAFLPLVAGFEGFAEV